MRLGDQGATYLSLPPNLQTEEKYALSAAIDRQMKKMLDISNMMQVWTDLDHVDPKYYGTIAACIKAPYYDSSFDDSTKLAIIKGTLNIYRLAGSRVAVEQLITNVFGSARFHAWFDYGGKPYHFKVTTDTMLTEDIIAKFGQILERVKRARSVIDAVNVHRALEGGIYAGTAVNRCMIPPAILETHEDRSGITLSQSAGAFAKQSYTPEAILEDNRWQREETMAASGATAQKGTLTAVPIMENAKMSGSIIQAVGGGMSLNSININNVKEVE